MRHLTQWASGEDLVVGESELSHLAMLMATASVLLDAWAHDKLIDHRIATPGINRNDAADCRAQEALANPDLRPLKFATVIP